MSKEIVAVDIVKYSLWPPGCITYAVQCVYQSKYALAIDTREVEKCIIDVLIYTWQEGNRSRCCYTYPKYYNMSSQDMG